MILLAQFKDEEDKVWRLIGLDQLNDVGVSLEPAQYLHLPLDLLDGVETLVDVVVFRHVDNLHRVLLAGLSVDAPVQEKKANRLLKI